jgi:hypothetical protein
MAELISLLTQRVRPAASRHARRAERPSAPAIITPRLPATRLLSIALKGPAIAQFRIAIDGA